MMTLCIECPQFSLLLTVPTECTNLPLRILLGVEPLTLSCSICTPLTRQVSYTWNWFSMSKTFEYDMH